MTGYPEHLTGPAAPPPEQAAARVLSMALKAHRKHLEQVDHELFTAAPTRIAVAIETLFTEANTAAPARNKASDGRIGDRRHQELAGPNGPGSGSDHNPWVIFGGKGIVRAGDLTNDPALDLPAAFERLRLAATVGQLPQVAGGGYLILAGRITAPDWSGWRTYKGSDPHVSHGHVSVGREAAAFDNPHPWGAFRSERSIAQPQPAPAPPAPVPAPGPGWTGPDLAGSGTALRGQQGCNGPRVQAWQRWLAGTFPAYRHDLGDLVADGWWGPVTTRWNREFGQRSGIGSADGLNIGPKLATAYARAGFGLSGARARVAGHVGRPGRR